MADKVDVLIAEDSPMQAKILQKRLTDAGHTVRWGENGRIALEMAHEQRPDIIISDVEMPEMSGHEFCEAIKNDSCLKTVPLILLSTLSEPEDIIRGLHVGADNYVTKPYQASYLLSRIEDLLKTPLTVDEGEIEMLDVALGGKTYQVKAGKQQVLNLLVSIFSNAVEKNNELVKTNEDLSIARDQLAKWNTELESLNVKLESANTRMSKDLNAAAKVQQSLLPNSSPKTTKADFSWKYLPCDELAGDFLNMFMLDEKHVALFVVDVSGHGVASSLLAVTIGRVMTSQISASSALVKPNPDGDGYRIIPPAEVAADLNRRFPMEDQGDLYFTMIYGILNLESLEFQYVSCGHPGIVHLPKGGEPKLIEAADLAVGWFDEIEFTEHSLTLAQGDRLVLYSDGVTEAMDQDLNQFGDDRMLEVLKTSAADPHPDSVASLFDAVEIWCKKNGPKDDVSILSAEIAL